jgi:hypothetical protein
MIRKCFLSSLFQEQARHMSHGAHNMLKLRHEVGHEERCHGVVLTKVGMALVGA